MNQRRKPKEPKKDAAPSDKTLILKSGSGEDPTVALDARATLALKGEEARRMQEATQAMPVQPPSDEPTQSLPLQPVPTEEPTVALPIGTATRPPQPPPVPPKEASRAGASTQQVRLEDIAWVAGEIPDQPKPPEQDTGSADPTSRMKMSLSELSRIMKEKEAALATPPESRRTAKLPPAAERSAATESTLLLSHAEIEQARVAGAADAAADRTLILKPDSPESATMPIPKPGLDRKEATEPVVRASIAGGLSEQESAPVAEATLILAPAARMSGQDKPIPVETTPVLKSDADEGTVPIHTPVAAAEPSTPPIPRADAPAAAEATLILRPGSQDGTVPILKPTSIHGSSTSPLPKVEAATEQIVTPAAPPPGPPKVAGPGGTVPVMRAALPEKPAPPPSQITGPPAPSPLTGPGGTVQLMRSETQDPPQPIPGTTRPRPAGGTVPVLRPAVPEAPAPAPKTQLMAQVEAAPPSPEPPPAPAPKTQLMAQVEAAPPSPEPPPAPAPKTQLMAQVEPAPPLSRAQADTSASLPPDASPRDPEPALSPASTRPVSTAPTPQGTLLVPVEELSRLSEVAAVSAEGRMGERPQQAAATAFSTRLMPQQAPPPAAAPARAPASVPATAAQTATSPRLMPQQAPPPAAAPARPPASVPATAAQTATSPRVAAAAARTTGPLPLQGKSPWKLWAGLAGLAMLGSAGMVLWLRPDLFGIGAESAGRPGPRSAADGPSRAVPASLRSTKEKADAGDAGAMRYLGTCYANGLGVPRDVEEAKRWYRRAAEAGSQAAREELANLQRQER